MIKWLKDRQLGNTVNKKTIYEHISVGRRFKYRGRINFERMPPESNERDWQCSNLKWTPDGNNLVIIMSEFLADRQTITILDPNADADHLVKIAFGRAYSTFSKIWLGSYFLTKIWV